MEFRETSTAPDRLEQYAALFRVCFPGATHLDERYLAWLYAGNPNGAVMGMDAWDGDRLAAHYVCVPGAASVQGESCRVLLSLNTATHPDYQGKGLFTKLAEATYASGTRLGFSAVYGIANANSTPGFVRKLGFSLGGALEAKVGVGRIDLRTPTEWTAQSSFHRVWDTTSLRWRCANPNRAYRLHRVAQGVLGASASTGKPFLRAWAELPSEGVGELEEPTTPPLTLRLHLGLIPRSGGRPGKGWIDVPQRFRASPLNFIFRDLSSRQRSIDPSNALISQLDFDAF